MAILLRLAVRAISTPTTRITLARHASQSSPFPASSGHRSYASQASQKSKSSEIPWYVWLFPDSENRSIASGYQLNTGLVADYDGNARMVGSIVLTVPALFYLLQSGPEETPHTLKPHRSITNEIEAHEEEKGVHSTKSEKPSDRDPVRR